MPAELTLAPLPARTVDAPGLPTHAIVGLNHVSKSFTSGGGPAVTILDDINFRVEEGEMLALLGQSGSGKSTILRLMAGLAQPSEGMVLCHGERLTDVNRSLSIVFQSFALYPWLTVSENVQVGLINRRLPAKEEEVKIERALELIGLSGYENACPKELSGGMRQRVGFARAHRNDEGWQLSPEGKFPQQFPAVPARQTDVREQDIESFVGGPGQGRAGTGGERATVPEEFQDHAEHGERVRMILDHEDFE